MVTVIILNPGKQLSGINYNQEVENTSEIQAIKTALSKDGKFSVDIKMNTSAGGAFLAVVQAGEKQISKSY